MLDSMAEVQASHGALLENAEWFFTILFTVEYVLRIVCTGRPMRYVGSFYGIVDLMAIVPTYMSVLFPGTRFLTVVRVLRLLRVFRVLKLLAYVSEAKVLWHALRASRRKITIFLFVVLNMTVIFGSLMYVIESEKDGFTSIPRSIYWAIVTMTTVGYGDISPQTPLGQAIAAVVMIFGYAIIAVPTGIISVEMAQSFGGKVSTQACPQCSEEGHDADAEHCKYCGAKL